MFTKAFTSIIETEFLKIDKQLEIISALSVSGGSINEAYGLITTGGSFFLKVNSAYDFPGMFEAEMKGLQTLRVPAVIDVPKPLFTGQFEERSFIVMTSIQSSVHSKTFSQIFGEQLANLHKVNSNEFGFESDNYIGSLPQKNSFHSNWADFFIHERLEPLLKKSRNQGELDAENVRRFEKLFGKLPDLFPIENPSLLHGDLWSGNYMSNEKGLPVIFDPAVYYGHREMDIAMTRLFGGFSNAFYDSYNEHFPMEKGWEDRLDLCNLYPLLVHVILFGGSYANSVRNILKRFV